MGSDEIEVSVGITVALSREEKPSAADEECLSLGTGESSISPKFTVMGENKSLLSHGCSTGDRVGCLNVGANTFTSSSNFSHVNSFNVLAALSRSVVRAHLCNFML